MVEVAGDSGRYRPVAAEGGEEFIQDVTITPRMVEAGFLALCSSAIADDYLEADKHTVAEIYRAMWLASERGTPPKA